MMHDFLILAWVTVAFGFTLETLIGNPIDKIIRVLKKHNSLCDRRLTDEDERLEGHTYVWMLPVYFLAPIVFLFFYWLISDYNIFIRIMVYGLLITAYEGFWGFAFFKLIGFCPWDYSGSKFKVFKNGFTKYTLIPAWAVVGIIIENLYLWMAAHVDTMAYLRSIMIK